MSCQNYNLLADIFVIMSFSSHFQTKFTIVYSLILILHRIWPWEWRDFGTVNVKKGVIFIFHRIWPWEQCDFELFLTKKDNFLEFSRFETKITKVYPLIFLFLSILSQMYYYSISTHLIDFLQYGHERSVILTLFLSKTTIFL